MKRIETQKFSQNPQKNQKNSAKKPTKNSQIQALKIHTKFKPKPPKKFSLNSAKTLARKSAFDFLCCLLADDERRVVKETRIHASDFQHELLAAF